MGNIFFKDHLLVRGGPFYSRIPYEHITKIYRTNIFILVIGYCHLQMELKSSTNPHC
ncbi:PH domain-containing protein [Gracilibacillus suaedae]|uniref:PH domain-containing protein n=1 Tax=Gracilibacillus suaedae TaxID=2820273 RepID=UPI002F3F51CB